MTTKKLAKKKSAKKPVKKHAVLYTTPVAQEPPVKVEAAPAPAAAAPTPEPVAKKTRLGLAAEVVRQMNKEFGEGAAQILATGNRSNVEEVIATSVDVINHGLLGAGGLPVGRIVEIFGSESSGKTALGLTALAAAQREGGVAVIVETEDALQTERADLYGCNIQEVIILQPDHLEDAWAKMYRAIEAIPKRSGPSVVVWDSVAATATKREIDEGLSEKQSAEMGERARINSQALRVISPLLVRKRVCLVAINQLRMKIGVMFGNPETTPGGNALKMHASVRIKVHPTQVIKDGSKHIGRYIKLETVKNKLAPPFAGVLLKLNYKEGWDNGWSTLNYAKDQKLAPTAGQGFKAIQAAYQALGWPIPGLVEEASQRVDDATQEMIGEVSNGASLSAEEIDQRLRRAAAPPPPPGAPPLLSLDVEDPRDQDLSYLGSHGD